MATVGSRGVGARRWMWLRVGFGLAVRTLGAGLLLWAVFPLWLSVFWTLLGYPPTLRDLPRWYALGAFNLAPIAAILLVSPLVLGLLAWLARRVERRGVVGVGVGFYALLTPPVAYALLLLYADMWQYRAWDAITPTLIRAYGLLAPACGLVGAILGVSMRR